MLGLPRLAWLLTAAAASLAQAQQVTLEPSAAVRCLTPAADQRGAPDYPFDAFKAERGGRVKVRLTFHHADEAPDVEVLERDGDAEFATSVRKHVDTFRVPCLSAAETPVQLTQEYIFKPDQRRIVWTHPQDQADAQRSKMLACVAHESGDKAPSYPRAQLSDGVQGRVLARLSFEAADRPPKINVFSRGYALGLARAIERWAEGYRMPCHVGAPVAGYWVFVFLFQGDGYYGFQDISLRQWIGNIKDIQKQTVAFDLNTMGCPFDLRIAYRQPYLPNGVGEVGSHDPARRPFLDWLAASELKLSESALDAVFADSARLHVPCLKIDLKPKEKP